MSIASATSSETTSGKTRIERAAPIFRCLLGHWSRDRRCFLACQRLAGKACAKSNHIFYIYPHMLQIIRNIEFWIQSRDFYYTVRLEIKYHK
ncbi:hypothetical protein ACMAUO_08780 [Gluconacetobacter sp. Hr-1-5]|uniref:hypothetical protein n=1 Tax=Gluconacetobacter sp. Hr-1-5 TaxID=3395370 RepID=UPI003B528FB7